MTGLFLSAWVLFPLLLLFVCAGSGLLVRRLSAANLSGVLLLPVGFALAVSICTLGTSMTWLAPMAGGLALLVAVIGALVESPTLIAKFRPADREDSLRPRPRRRIPRKALYPAIAAFVAFAAFAAPVVLTGTPTWTGYGRLVDIAFQMAFSEHLAEVGRQVPIGNSSFNETVLGLAANGYPGGAQATLGALAHLIRVEVPWCYQAYQAWAAAMGALALYALLRRILASALICCIGAAVAIQPNILYAYALVGGIKELTAASLILLVIAVLVEWLGSRHRSARSIIPLAPALAGAVAAFSYGVTPWLGLLLPAAFVLSLLLLRGRVRTLVSWGIAGVSTSILAMPSVISSIKLLGTAEEAVKGVVELGLGNLTAPISEVSAIGVWISNDYRFPMYAQQSASRTFDILIVVLAAIGVVYALRRRNWMIAAFGVAVPIALYYWEAHSGPWVALKAYTVTGTMALALAFIGAGWLARSRPPRLRTALNAIGWLAVIAVAGAVLYGNALTYHDMSLAPAARYRQLEQIGKRFAGIGPAFFPSFDEYSEYFLRREHGYDLVRPPGLRMRPGSVNLAPGQFAYSLDVNQLELSFLEGFPLLVISRSPLASRAPANYELAEKTAEFEVWRRVRPASEIVAHLPLSGSPTERSAAYCRAFLARVREAGHNALIAYVPSGPRTSLNPTQATHSSYWHPLGPDSLRAYGAGEVRGSISLPRGGTYDISMPGSIGRPVTLYVDGQRAGSIAYQERYPGQYLDFAHVRLNAGAHEIRLTRPNGNLAPGNGDGPDTDSGVIGSLIFTLEQPQNGQLKIAPAGRAGRICAAPVGYEWLEVLRPGTAPPGALPAPRS